MTALPGTIPRTIGLLIHILLYYGCVKGIFLIAPAIEGDVAQAFLVGLCTLTPFMFFTSWVVICFIDSQRWRFVVLSLALYLTNSVVILFFLLSPIVYCVLQVVILPVYVSLINTYSGQNLKIATHKILLLWLPMLIVVGYFLIKYWGGREPTNDFYVLLVTLSWQAVAGIIIELVFGQRHAWLVTGADDKGEQL